jgi:hypothetical protein
MPLGSAHHHVDVAAMALRAYQPLAPVRHCRFGTVSLGHFGRIRLDFVAAIFAPNDQLEMGRCGAAERRWRARLLSRSPLPSFCV